MYFSLRIPEVLSKVRAEGVNRNVVEVYFDLVKEIIEEFGVK
jgi:hypothetical protein